MASIRYMQNMTSSFLELMILLTLRKVTNEFLPYLTYQYIGCPFWRKFSPPKWGSFGSLGGHHPPKWTAKKLLCHSSYAYGARLVCLPFKTKMGNTRSRKCVMHVTLHLLKLRRPFLYFKACKISPYILK